MKLMHLQDSEATPVTLTPLEGGRYRVRIGERELEVDAVPVEQGVALRLDGRSYVVPLDARSGETFARVGGRRHRVVLEDARVYAMKSALGLGSGAATDRLESPMTGKVVLVAAAPGDAVSAGDTLVIIEAMKMENELRAETDGVVAEVFVVPDDLVNPGDPLVRFEIEEGDEL